MNINREGVAALSGSGNRASSVQTWWRWWAGVRGTRRPPHRSICCYWVDLWPRLPGSLHFLWASFLHSVVSALSVSSVYRAVILNVTVGAVLDIMMDDLWPATLHSRPRRSEADRKRSVWLVLMRRLSSVQTGKGCAYVNAPDGHRTEREYWLFIWIKPFGTRGNEEIEKLIHLG